MGIRCKPVYQCSVCESKLHGQDKRYCFTCITEMKNRAYDAGYSYVQKKNDSGFWVLEAEGLPVYTSELFSSLSKELKRNYD